MIRYLAALLASVTLGTACWGTLGAVPHPDRSSTVSLWFPEDTTEAAGELLAFDPSRHSLDIEIALPLNQSDDLEVYIVTSSGIRFQVLSSFQDCVVNSSGRRCRRYLPMLPSEGVDNWRVEARRGVGEDPAALRVDVTWVPAD